MARERSESSSPNPYCPGCGKLTEGPVNWVGGSLWHPACNEKRIDGLSEAARAVESGNCFECHRPPTDHADDCSVGMHMRDDFASHVVAAEGGYADGYHDGTNTERARIVAIIEKHRHRKGQHGSVYGTLYNILAEIGCEGEQHD